MVISIVIESVLSLCRFSEPLSAGASLICFVFNAQRSEITEAGAE